MEQVRFLFILSEYALIVSDSLLMWWYDHFLILFRTSPIMMEQVGQHGAHDYTYRCIGSIRLHSYPTVSLRSSISPSAGT